MSDQEYLSYLKEIAVNTALVLYYLTSSVRQWHEIISFINSGKAAIVAGFGAVIGYLIGRSK